MKKFVEILEETKQTEETTARVNERARFYKKCYVNGFYSEEKLIEIYHDYESHAEEWGRSCQRQNFICGQAALLRVIREIKSGVL